MIELLFTMTILGFALSDLYFIQKDWKQLKVKNDDNHTKKSTRNPKD